RAGCGELRFRSSPSPPHPSWPGTVSDFCEAPSSLSQSRSRLSQAHKERSGLCVLVHHEAERQPVLNVQMGGEQREDELRVQEPGCTGRRPSSCLLSSGAGGPGGLQVPCAYHEVKPPHRLDPGPLLAACCSRGRIPCFWNGSYCPKN
ncbi:hypothetical protein H1C71_032793, partial [Ictidomys tridecemlineatus]